MLMLSVAEAGVVVFGVDWVAVPRPSCSRRGPVDLGIWLLSSMLLYE